MPNDEDTLAHPEQPRFLLSAWLWAVMLFVFFGIIVAIAFGTMSRGSTYEEDRARNRTEKLKTARDEWTKTSSGYAWVDKTKGIARIPIERAMQLELADLQAKKPAPAGPIATPAPAESPASGSGGAQPANPSATVPASSAPTAPPTSRGAPRSAPARSAQPTPSPKQQ